MAISSRYEPLSTHDGDEGGEGLEQQGEGRGGGGGGVRRLRSGLLPVAFASLFVLVATLLSIFGSHTTGDILSVPPLAPLLRQDHSLSASRCQAEFPLYVSLLQRTQAMWIKDGRSAVRHEDIEAAERSAQRNLRWGYARVRVHGRQLFLRSVHEGPEARVRAALHLLHRAVAARPTEDGLQEPLELVFTTADKEGVGEGVYWALDRRIGADEGVWLMPDFGFAGWPSAGIPSYEEFLERAAEVEERTPWEKKDKRAFWRGFANVYQVRQDLLHRTSPSLDSSRSDWADVRETTFHMDAKPSLDPFVPLVTLPDHCAHALLVHAEGNSYSGRDKYLLSCHAVTIAHQLEWEQHFHAAFDANPLSDNQNLVILPPTRFEKIERAVKELRDSDKSDWTRQARVEERLSDDPVLNKNGARRIADNAVRTLRDRYLTPAATSCYLRLALSSYAATINASTWGPKGPVPAPGGALLPDTPTNNETALHDLGVGKIEHGDIEYGVWLQLGSPQWPPRSKKEIAAQRGRRR